MRDDAGKWDSVSSNRAVLSVHDVSIMQIQPQRQTMISAVAAMEQTPLSLVTWPGRIANNEYALVLRRDRILEVNGPERIYGWDESNACAVSDMTCGYSVLSVSGTSALPLLSRGGFVDVDEASGSVARVLFGMHVLLYQHNKQDQFSLHVGSAELHSLKSIMLSCYENM